MALFGRFYLDKEKDIIVDLFQESDGLHYVLRTPNHNSGNLITNLAKLCDLPLEYDEQGLKVIRGVIPCYVDGSNRRMYIFRMGNTKIANIFPDGSVEMKASVPAISKALMSQTKNYRLSILKTIVKTYIFDDCKFHADLHTHMSGNLEPDILIALGIRHQVRYPLYYIKKLGLKCSREQMARLGKKRAEAGERFTESLLSGKYLDRKIDDNTFINFADLILNNLQDAEYNIARIRISLAVPNLLIWKKFICTAMFLPKVFRQKTDFLSQMQELYRIRISRLCLAECSGMLRARSTGTIPFFRISCFGLPEIISATGFRMRKSPIPAL